MELRQALKEQYHGLGMLAECVEKCPEGVWLEGERPRTFWRIAFHAAFFTHLYLGQDEAAFQPWPGQKEGVLVGLWYPTSEVPEEPGIYQRDEILAYIRSVDELVDATVDGLDLDAEGPGFSWYPSDMGKLSHELMNLRHTQGHVGQLSELLMARGIDTDWIGRSGGLGH